VELKSTIVSLPELALIVARAEPFPEGIQAAFERIEGGLPTLRGRRFYGLAYDQRDGFEYFAGVVAEDDDEPVRLGLPTMVVGAGDWARTRLRDWEENSHLIPVLIAALIEMHGRDESRPVLEFYRSRTELELLVPVEC